MKFTNPPKLASQSISRYIQTELYSWLRTVTSGLLKLDFIDNFSSFMVDNVTIPPGETAVITNALKSTPSWRIIVRQKGNGLVTDGDWNIWTVSLINNGAVPVTISVIFFT